MICTYVWIDLTESERSSLLRPRSHLDDMISTGVKDYYNTCAYWVGKYIYTVLSLDKHSRIIIISLISRLGYNTLPLVDGLNPRYVFKPDPHSFAPSYNSNTYSTHTQLFARFSRSFGTCAILRFSA